MEERPTDGGEHLRLERAIETRVREGAPEWFGPGVAGAPVRLRRLSRRPRALMYAVHVGDHEAPRALAKVRLSLPGAEEGRPGDTRPRLSTGVLSVPEQTALEYDGLQTLFATFGGSPDRRYGAVRPLDHMVEESTILMEYVEARTLRELLTAHSRFLLPWPPGRLGRPEAPWAAVGCWLRTFHRSVTHEGLEPRQATRDEVAERFLAYGAFLSRRLGGDRLRRLAGEGAELATRVLPDRLPMSVGHGDFAPRNVFVRDDGRVVVFDPLPRWSVPVHEDLCRFLVGMRLLGMQVHSHGSAYSPSQVERWEDSVIRGYHGGDPVPSAALRCYELLILLDKWAALLDSAGRGPRSRVRTGSVLLATDYLRGQGERLLDLSSAAARSGAKTGTARWP